MTEETFIDTVGNILQDGLLVIDPETLKILFANPTAAALVGVDRDELTGKPLTAFCDIAPEHIRHIADATDYSEFNATLRSSDGNRFPITFRAVPANVEGKQRLICTIHGPFHQGDTPSDSPAHFTTLANSLEDLIIAFDLEGQITFANTFALKRLGYTADELIGKPLWTIHPAISKDEVVQLFHDVYAGKEKSCSISLYTANKITIPVEAQIIKTTLKGQTVLLAICRDITERVRAETLLRAQRDLGIALSVETNLEHALRRVVETAIEVAEMDAGGIYLFHPADGTLRLHYAQGLPEDFIRVASHYTPDMPQAHLVRKGKPVYARDADLNFPQDEIKRRTGLRSIAILPIFVAEDIIGALHVGQKTH